MNNLMRNIAFAATVLTLVFSCNEESMPDVVNRNSATIDFTASGHVTKTVFGIPDNGYYPVLWKENQKVALFYNSQTGGQDWTDGAVCDPCAVRRRIESLILGIIFKGRVGQTFLLCLQPAWIAELDGK